MLKSNPPFHADHVGSLLRPELIKENRSKWKKGIISHSALLAIEYKTIAAAVKKGESSGMRSIKDGEFRHDNFHLDFLQHLDGVNVSGGIAVNPQAKSEEQY